MSWRKEIEAACGTDLASRVELYNELVAAAAKMIGLPHPVLSPQLVPLSSVKGNDYNPNKVANPEMKLLTHSIRQDGITMGVVVSQQDDQYVVVDGFHRTTVVQAEVDIRESLGGYLPVVLLEKTPPELMASTVRHNMARGKHQVALTAKLVTLLTKHHWTNKRIGEEIGMEPDEVLRMKQVTGLAEAFADQDFSRAWE